jgi:hypothetical protein
MVESKNPHFEQAIRESFAAQVLMSTIGSRLIRVAAGKIDRICHLG